MLTAGAALPLPGLTIWARGVYQWLATILYSLTHLFSCPNAIWIVLD